MIQIILPKRLYPIYQRTRDKPWNTVYTIKELRAQDRQANRFKKRIKIGD